MSIDTENVLAELGSKIGRLQTLEYETEKRAKQRIDGFSTARHNLEWIRKLIKFAESGKKLAWVEGSLDDIQNPDFQAEELEGVPPHVIEHAIRTAKAAMANSAPSLV